MRLSLIKKSLKNDNQGSVFKLIFLDINMPEMNGFETFEAIKQMH